MSLLTPWRLFWCPLTISPQLTLFLLLTCLRPASLTDKRTIFFFGHPFAINKISLTLFHCLVTLPRLLLLLLLSWSLQFTSTINLANKNFVRWKTSTLFLLATCPTCLKWSSSNSAWSVVLSRSLVAPASISWPRTWCVNHRGSCDLLLTRGKKALLARTLSLPGLLMECPEKPSSSANPSGTQWWKSWTSSTSSRPSTLLNLTNDSSLTSLVLLIEINLPYSQNWSQNLFLISLKKKEKCPL